MKLSYTEATDKELKEIFDIEWKNSGALVNKLEKMGFSYAGTGSHSYVFLKSDKYKRVIKVAHTLDGWYRYAEYCKKNARRNPYLPKIYLMKTFGLDYEPDIGPRIVFYAAVMEKLEDIDNVRAIEREWVSEDELMILTVFDSSWVYTTLEYSAWAQDRNNTKKLSHNDVAELLQYIHRYVKENLKNHLLYKTLTDLKGKAGGANLDLVGENIMIRRSKKQMVLIDPLFKYA